MGMGSAHWAPTVTEIDGPSWTGMCMVSVPDQIEGAWMAPELEQAILDREGSLIGCATTEFKKDGTGIRHADLGTR